MDVDRRPPLFEDADPPEAGNEPAGTDTDWKETWT
jgi:hypothetical protein